MMKTIRSYVTAVALGAGVLFSGTAEAQVTEMDRQAVIDTTSARTVQTAIGELRLPQPLETMSVQKRSDVIGWDEEQTPVAPDGFTVTRFADNLDHPRWTYVATNGDYFVAESNDAAHSTNRISLYC